MPHYTFSGHLWPFFVSVMLVVVLGWYGWRHRNMEGAIPFAFGCLFSAAWALSSLLREAAVDEGAKVFWLKTATLFQLPVVTSATCFVLQYAGLKRWLTRPTLILLAIPSIITAALVLTDHLHHLAWNALPLVDGRLQPERGPGLSIALTFSYLLALVNTGVLAWLFVRSPRHRWPAALMIAGQIGARLVFEVGGRLGLPSGLDPDPFVLVAVFALYAVALFGFHVFDPIPAARAVAIEQMLQGMLVLDVTGRIVDVNPVAARALGGGGENLRGRSLDEVLPADLTTKLLSGDATHTAETGRAESELGTGESPRLYEIEATSLTDRYQQPLGRLILLHDVTEQKRAQAQLLQQERVVATLEERDRLARELHDSLGQVLGYISMQTQAIRRRVQQGDLKEADPLLARLVQVARDAHADVRESILALRTASPDTGSFLLTLRRYLESFREHYGLTVDMDVAEDVCEPVLDSDVAAQVLRVVQEALTNARRHGEASAIGVKIERIGDRVAIAITDDGRGFDSEQADLGDQCHFGLTFMRERMELIGGGIEIDSRPGIGTRVTLDAPLGPR